MRSLTLLCTFLLVFTLHAQILNVKKVKFGKISEQEMTMTSYALDEEAEAVVLYDKGILRMDFDQEKGSFQYLMDRHVRIKILHSSATHYGDFVFPLEKSSVSSAREEILNVRAATYNWMNGKEVETKLTKEGIFIEEVTDNYRLYKLALPLVKEGTVIELKYTLQSDFLYNLPIWEFQKEIPVDYSFFQAEIPEYFNYNVEMKGFASSSLIENVVGESGQSFVNLIIRTHISPSFKPSATAKSTQSWKRIEFGTKKYRWAAVEVPKLTDEDYSPTAKNYFLRVAFELANVHFPGAFINNYSTSWESISANYRESFKVRSYLNPRSAVAGLAAQWADGADSPSEKVNSIYEQLKKTIEWDEWFSRYPRQTPADVLKMKVGNSADINFMLLSMLSSQGIAAEPVLVSTRNNGLLSYGNPSLTQFNHVVVLVTLSPEKKLLLDATERVVPSFLLPKHNINERGRLISENSSKWIDLNAPMSDRRAAQFHLNFDVDGQLKGTMRIKQEGYAALNCRYEVKNQSEIETYFEAWSTATLDEVETTGFNDIYENITISAKIDFTNQVTDGGELFYIPSVLTRQFDENPFKEETRNLPIDFIVPRSYIYVTEINFPKGLILEEIPEPIDFSLPNNNGQYSIRYVVLGENIQIIEQLTIKETFYSQFDYAILRKFFDLVLENQATSLVVRRKE